MIAIFKWSINSGLPMGLRKARESLRAVRGDECDVSAPASHARVHDLSANAARDIRKLFTKKTLGVLVEQNVVSWNPISVWLRRIGTLRPAA